jgi:hypothetical protein
VAIYIITHKKVNKYGDDNYKLLQVGSILNKENFGKEYLRDDSGDNISNKNKTFCELTGLYWIWKNTDDQIVGIEHYRRYLSYKNNDPISYSNVGELLKSHDIILPRLTKVPSSVKYAYSLMHHEKDLYLLKDIITEKYPEYVTDFDSVLEGHSLYICNIMMCKKEILNQYCRWLFDILFEMEKRLDINEYDDRQKRVFGFLSERLLNVWIKHNNLNICEMKLINTEEKAYTNFTSAIYKIARYVFHIDILQLQVNRKFKIYHNQ